MNECISYYNKEGLFLEIDFFCAEHAPSTLPRYVYLHFSDHMICRGVISGKAGKAAALPKFSNNVRAPS